MSDSGTLFTKVDETKEPSSFAEYLKYLETRPVMQQYKAKLLSCMDQKVDSILNLGCGAGSDLNSLRDKLSPSGRIVAMDLSYEMLKSCRENNKTGIELVQASGNFLPFVDKSFSLIHIDRVLLHVPDAKGVIKECAHCLKHDGVLLIGEPDWGTFIVASSHEEINVKIKNFICSDTSCAYVSRYLPQWLNENGLSIESLLPDTAVLRDFQEFKRMMMLSKLLNRACDLGQLKQEEAECWERDLSNKSENNAFFCSYTNFIFKARK